jgi:uroporphyrinogen-III decarboxylase
MTDHQNTEPSANCTASAEYEARKKRLEDAIQLKKPDRVPIAPVIGIFYPTRIKGISNKDNMFNQTETYKAWIEAAVQHNWDTALPPMAFQPVKLWELLQITQMKWPGGQLEDNTPFQWVEGEYAAREDYDEMLSNPNSFAVKKFWPRIAKALAPISDIIQMEPPPMLYFSSAYSLPAFLGEMTSQPHIRQLLKTLLTVADEYAAFKEGLARYVTDAKSQGFPLVFGPQTIAAIDWVADVYRGLRGSMLDMYRVPDKLKALVDEFTPYTIAAPMLMDTPFECKRVFIPMHWGSARFMSDKQFAEFYWPSFKSLIIGLVDAGYTPVPLFEGDYTPRLNYLSELPAGKVAGHFDHIDRKKAKEIIGDTMCFWGNVPSTLLCTGTPQQVEDDVKELIDIFGDNGGLIIDCNMGIPDEAKPENVQAMTDAVMKYGIY